MQEKTVLSGGQTLLHHARGECSGEFCTLHNPSHHHMVDWPLNWREDRYLFERICPHGIGHPDVDSLVFLFERGHFDEGVHGCDGCCWA